jgi:uncharacterized protein YecT (DUF1311 family)
MFFLIALASTSCTKGSNSRAPETAGSRSDVTTTTVEVTYNRSCEKTAQTQTAMDFCAASELKDLQGQLATALGNEKHSLAAGLVDEAQAAFQRYATAECDAVASQNRGGSIYPLLLGTCEVGLTAQRIQQVRSDTLNAAQERSPSSQP